MTSANGEDLAPGGWMVRVTLSGAGGEPIERWYAVGVETKLDALLAVQKHLGQEARSVDPRRPLTATEIDRLGLRPDQVRLYT
jgi:hypothetical protein